MHFFDFVRGIPLCGEIRLDGLVHDRNECDDVAKWHERRRTHAVGLVLLRNGVAQSNFVLVVEPVLIVRA